MKIHNLLSLYGLKWNPFENGIPLDGIAHRKEVDQFCWRVENLAMDGGFGMITGNPGVGKSVMLRILANRLSQIPDLRVGVISRPQSGLADFYRELGEIFEIEFSASNRWGGFRRLRDKWQNYLNTTLFRPVLLIDEAQELIPLALNEIRLLSSSEFDSKNILAVIFSGDLRFSEKLQHPILMPLGSRIGLRFSPKPLTKEDLVKILLEVTEKAGNKNLMTIGLIELLAEHAGGNLRTLMSMSNNLLAEGVAKERPQLDESLFFELFNPSPRK